MIARQANAAAGGPLMTPDEWTTRLLWNLSPWRMNFNRANLRIEPVNVAINDAIERVSGDHSRAAAPLSRRQHRRRRNACAKFNMIGGASPRIPRARARDLPARALFRGAIAPASDRGRLQICAA